MIHQVELSCEPKQYSALGLAYIGDVVYELMVRERIVARANMPVNRLHQKTVRWVCASAQSRAMELLLPLLTEEEEAVYRRGRNANSHAPKNADVLEYHRATGFEALFGYLYLSGQHTRIEEFFTLIWMQFSFDKE